MRENAHRAHVRSVGCVASVDVDADGSEINNDALAAITCEVRPIIRPEMLPLESGATPECPLDRNRVTSQQRTEVSCGVRTHLGYW